MDFGNDLALVALIVSLVALMISTGQVLQQYFGTADGYRRCQDSVMGPWSSYTRLRWRWSELRFETRFTTPEIQLLCKHEMVDRESIRSKWSWRKFAWETMLMRQSPNQYQAEVAADLWDVPMVTGRGQRRYARDMMDFEITDSGDLVPAPLRRTVQASRQSRSRGTDLVTWTRLLRSLHQHQVRSAFQSVGQDDEKLVSEPWTARVVIRMNEWSWDLVPPDLVRPFATSTVGCFISLAHRLGMQWQALDPSRGNMSAEGHGHTINCTSIRGLGIVLQYSYNARLDPKEKCVGIPTHDADKLRCGIIPASGLVGEDHSVTGADGEHTIAADLFRKLGVTRAVRATLTNEDHLRGMRGTLSNIRHVYNDMVCLLSPWLPLHNDWRNEIVWPIRTSGLHSAMIFWEGRKTLYQRLQQYVREKNLKSGDLAHEVLTDTEWIQSEEHYHSNFYCKWATAVEGESETRQFISDLRKIFDRTTKSFRARQNLTKLADRAFLLYSDLVSAHITMATEIGPAARERFDNRKGRTDGSKPPSDGWVPFMFEVAHSYVDNLPRVVQLVRERGCQLPDLEIEALWWLLMLKGICWSMALNVSLMESVVPSYLYYSATPVYII